MISETTTTIWLNCNEAARALGFPIGGDMVQKACRHGVLRCTRPSPTSRWNVDREHVVDILNSLALRDWVVALRALPDKVQPSANGAADVPTQAPLVSADDELTRAVVAQIDEAFTPLRLAMVALLDEMRERTERPS